MRTEEGKAKVEKHQGQHYYLKGRDMDMGQTKTRNVIIAKRRDTSQQTVGLKVVERKVRDQGEEKGLGRRIRQIRQRMSNQISTTLVTWLVIPGKFLNMTGYLIPALPPTSAPYKKLSPNSVPLRKC